MSRLICVYARTLLNKRHQIMVGFVKTRELEKTGEGTGDRHPFSVCRKVRRETGAARGSG